MKQNIYDNPDFSAQYDELRFKNKGKNANDLIEIPNFRKIMPDVKGKTILDLGCGYGENDKYFIEQGAKYIYGIDISEHMIEIANIENKDSNIAFNVLAMENLSTIDLKFDIVISSLAFHYIKDFNKLLADINSLLTPGGILVFSQEHPFTTCTKYTENLKKGHTIIDGKYYGVFSDYNRPGIRIREWFDQQVIKYHRTFSEIINSLVQNGFNLLELEEPSPSEEAIQNNPAYVSQWDRPFYIFISAQKKAYPIYTIKEDKK